MPESSYRLLVSSLKHKFDLLQSHHSREGVRAIIDTAAEMDCFPHKKWHRRRILVPHFVPHLQHLLMGIGMNSRNKRRARRWPVLREQSARFVPHPTSITQRLGSIGASPPLRRLLNPTMRALASRQRHNIEISGINNWLLLFALAHLLPWP